MRTDDRVKAMPLDWQRLRTLSLPPARRLRLRGRPFLSAASGLVCAFGRIYVVADDEHHLAVFSDLESPADLHRLLPGELPRGKAERKARKADLETVALLPAAMMAAAIAGAGAAMPSLLMMGSGSTPQRDVGVLQPLDASGDIGAPPRRLDLSPLYEALRARLGAVNIEGLVCSDDSLWLFNRGGEGKRGTNAVVRYGLDVLRALVSGDAEGGAGRAVAGFAPISITRCELGRVHGVGYGFTDAAALPARHGGGWLFAAVAEASADSVADGACVGSAVGCLSTAGEVQWLRPLRGAPKVEGIDLRADAEGLTVCLVTDADDPDQASCLLWARP